MDWQRIETAPKTHDHILVGFYIGDEWIVRRAFWHDGHTEYGYDHEQVGFWSYENPMTRDKLSGESEPTHWCLDIEPPPSPY